MKERRRAVHGVGHVQSSDSSFDSFPTSIQSDNHLNEWAETRDGQKWKSQYHRALGKPVLRQKPIAQLAEVWGEYLHLFGNFRAVAENSVTAIHPQGQARSGAIF
jgi:hypothetical protein